MSLPYLPLYIDDYEGHTAHLTLLEDGIYNRLLRLLWRSPGCSVPDDDEWVFRRLRASTEAERATVLTIIDEFFDRKNGRIVSNRLMREFKKVNETSRKRSQAGKLGGRPQVTENKEQEEKPGFFSEKQNKSPPSQPEPEPEKEEYYTATGERSVDQRMGELYDALGVTNETKLPALLTFSEPIR